MTGELASSFKYRRVLALVVESGAVYSSALVIEITLYFLNSNAFYIIYDPIAQLTVRHRSSPLYSCIHVDLGYRPNNDHRNDEFRFNIKRSHSGCH